MRDEIESELILDSVTEYCEDLDTSIIKYQDGPFVIHARNEGGHNSTEVDLDQLLQWLVKNRLDYYLSFVDDD